MALYWDIQKLIDSVKVRYLSSLATECCSPFRVSVASQWALWGSTARGLERRPKYWAHACLVQQHRVQLRGVRDRLGWFRAAFWPGAGCSCQRSWVWDSRSGSLAVLGHKVVLENLERHSHRLCVHTWNTRWMTTALWALKRLLGRVRAVTSPPQR